MTLSVVIPAHNAAWCLPRCLESLHAQDPPPAEVIVVDDGSNDGTAKLATDAGARVVRHRRRSGPEASRATGAAAASGDGIAFLDADDWVEPGYVAALERAFADGADLVATAILPQGSGAVARVLARRGIGHDLEGRNGFLPAASGTGLAIRRSVLDEVGGFDPLLRSDADISYRCGLAGYRLTSVPGARVRYRLRTSYRGLLKQRAVRAYWNAHFAWKYQRFEFALNRRGPLVLRELAKAAILLGAGRPRAAADTVREVGVRLALICGRLAGTLDILLLRRRPPPILEPASPAAALTASPLPEGPAALLTGDERLVRRLARALAASRDLASPPPDLASRAVANWSRPAPPAARLAREARAAGWPISVTRASRRLDAESPRTWGDAYLALHGVCAAAIGKRSYVLAAPGETAAAIVPLLRAASVIHLGSAPPPVPRATTLRDLDDPEAAAAAAAAAVGSSPTEMMALAIRLAPLLELTRLPLIGRLRAIAAPRAAGAASVIGDRLRARVVEHWRDEPGDGSGAPAAQR